MAVEPCVQGLCVVNSNWFALVEMVLVFGSVLGFCWYQLRELRKYRDKDDDGGQ